MQSGRLLWTEIWILSMVAFEPDAHIRRAGCGGPVWAADAPLLVEVIRHGSGMVTPDLSRHLHGLQMCGCRDRGRPC
jgi:hypothetical protein